MIPAPIVIDSHTQDAVPAGWVGKLVELAGGVRKVFGEDAARQWHETAGDEARSVLQPVLDALSAAGQQLPNTMTALEDYRKAVAAQRSAANAASGEARLSPIPEVDTPPDSPRQRSPRSSVANVDNAPDEQSIKQHLPGRRG